MRSMNSETVDLIATDPPFNKGKDFHATPDSLASGASFQDRWSWNDAVDKQWVDQIADDWPNVWYVIECARGSWGDDMGAYLCFMGVRLIAMQRLLKPTGSIYLHCDPTASHYLKMLMDAIFGRKNFRNEIVWCYHAGGASTRYFPKKHDVLLLYGKNSDKSLHNPIRGVPYRDIYAYSKDGEIQTQKGYHPDGKMMSDWWKIPQISSVAKERFGYPTQKPLALYDRIIKASSNEGDMVLDPFCGCATTCVAAERLGRQWIGIDIWEKAQDAIIERMESEGLKASKYTKRTKTSSQQFHFEEFTFTDELPKRTDDEKTSVAYLETKIEFQKEPWEKLSRRDMVHHLAAAQKKGDGVICGGCGRELEVEFMELDHIDPRAGGGSNYISNRILLCSPCNKKKRHKLTLIGLIEANVKDEWMCDKGEAYDALSRARRRHSEVRAEHVQMRFSDSLRK